MGDFIQLSQFLVTMKEAKAAISRVKTLAEKLENLSFIHFLSYYSF